jgi:pimeloyl-ACP methyl ester carboxylesterase
VLVHGLASNARLWDGPARHLAQLGHAVVAIDLRGHGHSDKVDHGYSVPEVAHDVADVLLALKSRQKKWDRPIVAGQSWGGNIVVELAHSHGDMVRGIVAVDGGTIELAGSGANAFQTIRGTQSRPNYKRLLFSGANTYGLDYNRKDGQFLILNLEDYKIQGN